MFSRSRVALGLAAGAGLVGACNAILGVQDVRLAGGDAGEDAGEVDADAIDAAIDRTDGVCDPAAIFGAPMPLPGVNTTINEKNPFLTDDERTLYFVRQDDAGSALLLARRGDRGAAFGDASVIMTDNSPTADAVVAFSSDVKTIFWASADADGGNNKDIYIAIRSSPDWLADAGFERVEPISALASPFDERRPFLRPDGRELWFSSNRYSNGVEHDLYRSTVADGSFSAPVRVDELASASEEFDSVISADGLVVFFTSNRPGSLDAGGYAIWTARRDRASAPFGAPAEVVELGSPGNHVPRWLSPDGCRLYFWSTRTDGAGGTDIWVAERLPK